MQNNSDKVRPGLRWQVCVEGGVRNPAVGHLTDMTDPTELCSLMMNASIPDILHLFSKSVSGILSCHLILAM